MCIFTVTFFWRQPIFFLSYALKPKSIRFQKSSRDKLLDKDSEIVMLTDRCIIKNVISKRVSCKCSLKNGSLSRSIFYPTISVDVWPVYLVDAFVLLLLLNEMRILGESEIRSFFLFVSGVNHGELGGRVDPRFS